jgi:RNA polymerase sigma factor (sigma-70 family)
VAGRGHLVSVSPTDGADRSDAALWRQAASGCRESFGLLFDRHSGAVCNYLFRRTADWSVAEDLTAAVFLQAWRKRGQVTFDGNSVLPWLLGVARLLLRNTVRARARYQAALSRAGAEPASIAAELGDPADLVSSRLDSERQMTELRRAISGLPMQQRDVIELHVFAGLDQQAVAIAMGVSVGTVKSRLHRARQHLAAELREPAAEELRTARSPVQEAK